MTPTALGHDDEGDDPPGSLSTGVSGRYVGSWAAALNSGPPIVVLSGPPVTAFIHSGVLASGVLIYCDLEVPAGPGELVLPTDEVDVDQAHNAGGLFLNAVTATGPLPSPVPLFHPVTGDRITGGWDDGGHGGACHMNNYAHEPYNTPGCPADLAYANDDVFGPAVFTGAACDWEVQGPSDSCGSDSFFDGTTYGWGGDGVPYPSGAQTAQAGETYDPSGDDDGNACPPSDATAAVFVFDTFDIATGDVTLAVSGDIWQA